MFKTLLLASAVTTTFAITREIFNAEIVCPEGQTNNLTPDSGVAISVTSCCEDIPFKPTCANGGTDPSSTIACPSGQKLRYYTTEGVKNVTTCCEPFTSTCQQASYVATESSPFKCAEGTTFNRSAYDANSSQSACCQAFAPDCGHVTEEVTFTDPDGNGYNIFDCALGSTLNVRNLTNTTVDQATCCMAFNATCDYYTGSILLRKPFPCATGSSVVSGGDKVENVANATTCCKTYDVSCGQLDDAGAPFECKTGTVFNTVKIATQDPSQDKCCMEPTCQAASQMTCADLKANGGICSVGFVVDDSKTASIVSGKNAPSACCKVAPTAAVFSGSSSLRVGAAAAIATVASVLLR